MAHDRKTEDAIMHDGKTGSCTDDGIMLQIREFFVIMLEAHAQIIDIVRILCCPRFLGTTEKQLAR